MLRVVENDIGCPYKIFPHVFFSIRLGAFCITLITPQVAMVLVV